MTPLKEVQSARKLTSILIAIIILNPLLNSVFTISTFAAEVQKSEPLSYSKKLEEGVDEGEAEEVGEVVRDGVGMETKVQENDFTKVPVSYPRMKESNTVKDNSSSNTNLSEVPVSFPVEELPNIEKPNSVSNFSLEETNQGVIVRWPAIEGASGYYIYHSDSQNLQNSASKVSVNDCTNAENSLGGCTYLITNLTNGEKHYFDISAFNTGGEGERTGVVKTATPFEIVIDDSAVLPSPMGSFMTMNDSIDYSTNRSQAKLKSDKLYNAVGEDHFLTTGVEGMPVLGLWQTSNKLNGIYDVYVTYQTYDTYADKVFYRVGGNDDQTRSISEIDSTPDNVIMVNQRKDSSGTSYGGAENGRDSGWTYLGTFNFQNATGIISILGDENSGGPIIMDAVAFQKNDDYMGKINVEIDVFNQNGSDIFSDQLFKVTIKQNEEIIESSDASDSADKPQKATFDLEIGEYVVEIEDIENFTNMGCFVDEDKVDSVELTRDEVLNIVCEVQLTNTMPMVTITSNATTVTKPNIITLTANVTGGNGELRYAWLCIDGITSNAKSITLTNVGTYECSVAVSDEDGDIGIAGGVFVIREPVIQPTQTTTTFVNSGFVGQPFQTTQQTTPTPQGSINGDGISTEDEDVLGLEEQTCDVRSTAAGYVYIDAQVNNEKDPEERGISDVELIIFYNAEDEDGNIEEREIRRVRTNTLGRWETRLCPGEYMVRINQDDLGENIRLGGDDRFAFSIVEGENNENISFATYDQSNTNQFNIWYCLIPLILLMLIAAGYAIIASGRDRNPTSKTTAGSSTTSVTPLPASNQTGQTTPKSKGSRKKRR